MTCKERRKIEKMLLDAVEQAPLGSADQKTAIDSLLRFQEKCEETRKNKANEELEKQKIDNESEKLVIEREKILSQEKVASDQRKVEREKLRQDKEIAERQIKIDQERLEVEKKASKTTFLAQFIIEPLAHIIAFTSSTIAENKFTMKLAKMLVKFEETGTVSSFTSKTIFGNILKRRKH